MLTLGLLDGGVPPAQWARLSRRLAAVASADDADARGVEFNEFASLFRIVDLSGGVGKVDFIYDDDDDDDDDYDDDDDDDYDYN